MKVSVTRQEIEQSNELLELLKTWEPLCNARREYSNGMLHLSVNIDSKTQAKVSVHIDRYRSNTVSTVPIHACQREIDALAREAAEKLAAQVCELIKKHMPIPISE